MRIAVTSDGNQLSSKVGRKFGKADWLVVVDTGTDQIETHKNKVDQDAHIHSRR